MVTFLYNLAKAARVRQWLKNLVIFAAIVFTGEFFNASLFQTTVGAIFVFCLISSGIYLLNDVVDVKSDGIHPFKKYRPIASGKISIQTAKTLSIIFILFGVICSLLFFPRAFFIVTLIFLTLQISYTFILKHIPLVDVLAIASAFILRVFAGEAATGFHISIWLFLTVVSLALFLALGKRRGELTLLSTEDGVLPKTRATLLRYSEKMLDVYLSMFSTATWLLYTFYTFLAKPPLVRQSINVFLEDNLSIITADRKWLMLSIPFVIYGVMRYLQLIYEKHEGESPDKILLTDKPLIITIILWGLITMTVIYGVGK
ncbi:MAG: UbiA prenyltransferase family protein [bacterium]|nr:UbiA prenyltransferase family protein [bacterium]